MATHFSVLAWRIPGTGEPCGLWGLWGPTESDMTEATQQQQQQDLKQYNSSFPRVDNAFPLIDLFSWIFKVFLYTFFINKKPAHFLLFPGILPSLVLLWLDSSIISSNRLWSVFMETAVFLVIIFLTFPLTYCFPQLFTHL